MNTKSRPSVYDNTDETVRNKNMGTKPEPVQPNNEKRKLADEDYKPPTDYNVDVESVDQLISWLKQQIKNDPNFYFRGYRVVNIDTKNNSIKLFNVKTGKEETRRLPEYLGWLKEAIKDKQGKTKIDGNTVSRQQIINLIKADIANGRTFKGKQILSIDADKNTVTIEGNNIFGINDTISLDTFIKEYQEVRQIGGYGDSAQIAQDLAEQTRMQNIEDMTTAFRNALGIKPPKVVAYAPIKDTRAISQLAGMLTSRDEDTTWTIEEVSSVVKTGNVPNSSIQVNGGLNNYFSPTAPEQKTIKVGAIPKAGIFDSHIEK